MDSFFNRIFLLLSFLPGFLFLILCSKNNTPFEYDSHYFIFDQAVIQSWPDSLIATGIGKPDTIMPISAQRAGTIRSAKVDLLGHLQENVFALPISRFHSLGQYCQLNQNDTIETEIYMFSREFSLIDTRFMSDGSVEVDGFLLTEEIVQILNR
jgi:hypothetical protein